MKPIKIDYYAYVNKLAIKPLHLNWQKKSKLSAFNPINLNQELLRHYKWKYGDYREVLNTINIITLVQIVLSL